MIFGRGFSSKKHMRVYSDQFMEASSTLFVPSQKAQPPKRCGKAESNSKVHDLWIDGGLVDIPYIYISIIRISHHHIITISHH